LADLLARGRLQPTRAASHEAVTYHDPCYLGRYGGEVQAPRALLQGIGIEVREMQRNRAQGRCCGGGGGATEHQRRHRFGVRRRLGLPVRAVQVFLPEEAGGGFARAEHGVLQAAREKAQVGAHAEQHRAFAGPHELAQALVAAGRDGQHLGDHRVVVRAHRRAAFERGVGTHIGRGTPAVDAADLRHEARGRVFGAHAQFDRMALAPARGQQRFEPADHLGKVLPGQDFGGRHQRALPTRVDRLAGGQGRDHRLARTHIALQQAVHGPLARQIGGDFRAHAALGSGQIERQHGQQLPLQGRAAVGRRLLMQHRGAQPGTLAPRLLLRQLLRQQLLGLQALPGRVAVVLQRGQRHIPRRSSAKQTVTKPMLLGNCTIARSPRRSPSACRPAARRSTRRSSWANEIRVSSSTSAVRCACLLAQRRRHSPSVAS
ncbi:(Fe-S)-binding protein, partial [Verminephrobacter sp. Larva24]